MMSQASISTKPAPSAGPFTAAITGLAQSRHRVEELAHQPVVADVVARRVHHADTLLEVGAGGERVARAGEDDDAHVVAVAERVEHADQFLAGAGGSAHSPAGGRR